MKKSIITKIMIMVIIVMGFAMVFNKIQGKQEDMSIEKHKKIYNEYLDKLYEYTNRVNSNEENLEEELLTLVDNTDNILDRATYLNVLSYYYLIMGENDKHVELGELSIKEFNKVPEGGLLALESYTYMINNTVYLNDLERGLRYCYEALNLIKGLESRFLDDEYLNRFKLIVDCNYIKIYATGGLMEKATYHYNQISNISEDDPIYEKSESLIVIAKHQYHTAMKNYKEMLEYTLKYQSIMERSNNPHKDGLRINIANALILNGREDEALEHIQVAEKFYNEMKMPYEQAYVKNVYGKYYLAKGDNNMALKNLVEAYETIRNVNGLEEVKMDFIENILMIKGNLNIDAGGYLREYINLNKEYKNNNYAVTLFNTLEEINKKTYESQIILHEKDKVKLEDASNDKRNLIIMLMASGIIMVLFILKLKKEVGENKKYQKQLLDIANKDYLTKTYTRFYGMDKLREYTLKTDSFCVALVDIDNFKNINDTYGHVFGDTVLKELSNILMEKYKDSGIVVRYGGEEFLVVCHGELDKGYNLLEEVKKDISNFDFENGLKVTFSGGIKKWQGESLNQFISDVDKLLYVAKNEGKNRIISN